MTTPTLLKIGSSNIKNIYNSGSYDSSTSADKLFDGSASTGWNSYANDSNGNTYVTIQLYNKAALQKLSIKNISAITGSLYGLKDYIIYGSNDNVNFAELYSENHANDSSNVDISLNCKTNYLYYKFESLNSWYDGKRVLFNELEYYVYENYYSNKILLSSTQDNVVRSANVEKCMHVVPNSNVQFNDKVFSARATSQSIMFKFKCDAIPSTTLYIFMHNATGSAVWATVNSSIGTLSVASFSDNSSYASINLQTNSPILNICDGKWHTIVYTWDGTKNSNGAKLYVDNMNTPYTTQTVTYTRTIETTGSLYLNLTKNGDFYLRDFASLTRVATTQELLDFQNDKLSLTTSGLNAYFKFQDSMNGIVENLVSGTTIKGTTNNVELIKPKIIQLDSVSEDEYLKYGIKMPLDFNESFAGAYNVKKLNNVLGSGKTFEHTIDLSKRRIDKITLN